MHSLGTVVSYDACVLDACLHLLGGRNFYRLVLIYVILIAFRDYKHPNQIKAIQEPSVPESCFREGDSETVSMKEAVRPFPWRRQWEGEWFWNYIPSFFESLLFREAWNVRHSRQVSAVVCPVAKDMLQLRSCSWWQMREKTWRKRWKLGTRLFK